MDAGAAMHAQNGPPPAPSAGCDTAAAALPNHSQADERMKKPWATSTDISGVALIVSCVNLLVSVLILAAVIAAVMVARN